MSKNKKSAKRLSTPKRIIISIILILLLAIGWFSGTIPYYMKYIECGKAPITGSSFAASFTYQIPGDEYYGPGMFKSYYCNDKEAWSDGLSRWVK